MHPFITILAVTIELSVVQRYTAMKLSVLRRAGYNINNVRNINNRSDITGRYVHNLRRSKRALFFPRPLDGRDPPRRAAADPSVLREARGAEQFRSIVSECLTLVAENFRHETHARTYVYMPAFTHARV